MSTTPRLDNLAAHGTNHIFTPVRLADGHTLTIKVRPGAATAEEVFLYDGLNAPDTDAWESEDDREERVTGALYRDVPVRAVRELIEQHGGEHTEQDRRTYRVTILRAERIEFTVEADSPEDAEARYLADGIEVGSETDSTSVESVTLDQE
ncbi:hypothetical protein ABZX74_39725 [Streptomyces olivaceoviridis]|uniref:hypothetical protein n=1 Tax=Streptomyces olivaceoviridis TaxID=1921 RepID=UPI0033ADF5B5